VLSTQWVITYGSAVNTTISPNGQTFVSNDFTVPAPGTIVSTQVSMSGTITSIIGYTCQVIDASNITYTLYLGSGTSIQSVNSPVPEVGNTIYWLGTQKPGGLPT
jgi:hypothetical protein